MHPTDVDIEEEFELLSATIARFEELREEGPATLKLRAEVEIVAPGSLPNDGKVIDDQRDYDS